MNYKPGYVGNKILDAIEEGHDVIINEGGTWSGKTFDTMIIIIILCTSIPGLRVRCCSVTTPHLKEGVITDFKTIMGIVDETNEPNYQSTNKTYVFPNGSIIKFIAFDKPGKGLGPKYDISFLNEGNNITWGIADAVITRTKKITLIDHNPVKKYWAHKQFIGQENCKYIHSTYQDNIHNVPSNVINYLEDKKIKDPNGYRIMALGLLGRIEGQVYTDYHSCKEKDIPDGGFVCYGLDWGFRHKFAFVKLWIFEDPKKIYVKEMIAESGLIPDEIEQRVPAIAGKTDEIFCDDAYPDRIKQLRKHCNAKRARKSKTVEEGVDFVRNYIINIVDPSPKLKEEIENYTYVKTADGEITKKIDKGEDDLLDAMRYAVWGKNKDINISVKKVKL